MNQLLQVEEPWEITDDGDKSKMKAMIADATDARDAQMIRRSGDQMIRG